ncbi:hypothetical protein Tco_1128935 [Tanacetum coccineum]
MKSIREKANQYVSAVYLQQFWQTVYKVPDTKDTIRFKLNTQEITYTMDMFRDTLNLPVETTEISFVALVNIEIIESFMNRVGYQGVVDKYPRFTKLISADQMKKFPSIPPRTEEDYHSIKDDILLVSVYTTGNVTVRGMLIPDAFLIKEIRATDDFNEYETGKKRKQSVGESNSPQKSLKITIRQKKVGEGEKGEQSYDDVDDSDNRLEPESHKENPEYVNDDDDKE